MRIHTRIFGVALMLLLVPAFAQVLAARVLLQCADGRSCFIPPHEIQSECVEETSCCGEEEPAPVEPVCDEPASPCVWMVVPGLDLNHTNARSAIDPPSLLLTLASRDLLDSVTRLNESQCIGRPIEHVPIDWPSEVLPGEGQGPRSPPHDDV